MVARKFAISALTGITITIAVLAGHIAAQPPTPLKIGMVSTLFRDTSESKVQALLPELKGLMKDHTGLDGEFIIVGDTQDLVNKLKNKEMHFGVFHGFEFAWARQSDAELKPLLIAINRHRSLKAIIVTLADGKITEIADLKGKAITIPKGLPEHCRMFVERELAAMNTNPKAFFASIVSHENGEDALDDVLRNKVQAALVDGEGLENYEQVNPGRFARLKVLKQADGFPPGLVAYRQGAVDDATVTKFKEGMLKANSTVTGREQMAMWRLKAFENIPADYEQSLSNIIKRFPPSKGK